MLPKLGVTGFIAACTLETSGLRTTGIGARKMCLASQSIALVNSGSTLELTASGYSGGAFMPSLNSAWLVLFVNSEISLDASATWGEPFEIHMFPLPRPGLAPSLGFRWLSRSPEVVSCLGPVFNADQDVEKHFLQLVPRREMCRVVPQVVEFVRIAGQVVELAGAIA